MDRNWENSGRGKMMTVVRKRKMERKTTRTRRRRKKKTYIRMDFRGRMCGKTWICMRGIRRGTKLRGG